MPVPVAMRSKAWVCTRSPGEIVGSNPTGGAWISVSCECCVSSGRGLCDELITRPEESTDCGASLCVIEKPRECGGPGPLGAVAPNTKLDI